jgi:hypothetical protein
MPPNSVLAIDVFSGAIKEEFSMIGEKLGMSLSTSLCFVSAMFAVFLSTATTDFLEQ